MISIDVILHEKFSWIYLSLVRLLASNILFNGIDRVKIKFLYLHYLLLHFLP